VTSGRSDSNVEGRKAKGRGVRERTSRQSLGHLAERPVGYDAVAQLINQGVHRVASLLPLRYERMLESPLAFYRGSALLMADDLARGASTDLEVQIVATRIYRTLASSPRQSDSWSLTSMTSTRPRSDPSNGTSSV